MDWLSQSCFLTPFMLFTAFSESISLQRNQPNYANACPVLWWCTGHRNMMLRVINKLGNIIDI